MTETAQQDDRLLFYKIMKYPVPSHETTFFHTDKKTENIDTAPIGAISREHINPLMEEYLEYIKKRSRLFKTIPFVKNIYLCNSLSFNSIHEDSDIDIFIVTKKKALRRARFASVVFFWIFRLKRSMTNKRKKFCLSFYVTEDQQNLYNISLPNTDIYLAYWIAHLIPIYQSSSNNTLIYKHNTRISSILANISPKQNIFLDIPVTEGDNKVKKVLERLQGGLRGKLVEKIIKTIWLPIMIYKTKKLKGKGEDIIINNHMLKFYADQRKKIALLYKVTKDKFSPNKIKR